MQRTPSGRRARARAAAGAVLALALAGHAPCARATGAPASPALVARALGWASARGLQMSPEPGRYVHAPLALVPFPLDREAFETARALAPLFNELVEAVSRDHEWLGTALAATSASDEFTGQLAALWRAALADGAEERQPLRLGIHRSDYMVDESSAADGARPLQVELNTIASSFGCLSGRLSELHAFLRAREHGACAEVLGAEAARAYAREGALPENEALRALPDALAAAVAAYGAQQPARAQGGASPVRASGPAGPALTPSGPALTSSRPALTPSGPAVLFVVQPGESNVGDQLLLELALWERHGVPVLRRTLAELAEGAALARAGGACRVGALLVQEGGRAVEVGVVYFRAGYGPADYPAQSAWDARLLLERSAAIKCPCLGYQLAGTKKVQQLLAQPGALQRLGLPPAACAAMARTFAGLYSLQTEGEYAHALRLLEERPEGYVLKPQREGGGHNTYGRAVLPALRALPAGQREGFILMERIQPTPRRAALCRDNQVAYGEATCELGVFGVYLGGGGAPPLLNSAAGHLLRTKLVGTDEGGVAAGFAVLSSPLLC